MLLSVLKSVQNDSIKCEIKEAVYAATEGASNIPFEEALKTA